MKVILSRFKECSSYKKNIEFYFVDGINTTLEDIDKAIKNNAPETNVPFGTRDRYLLNADINYHLSRVIYFINHPKKIKDIKVKSSWWIENNTLYAYPHLMIEDGYHRIAAAFYLDLNSVNMINHDYIRHDVLEYITGKTNIKPKKTILKINLGEEV